MAFFSDGTIGSINSSRDSVFMVRDGSRVVDSVRVDRRDAAAVESALRERFGANPGVKILKVEKICG